MVFRMANIGYVLIGSYFLFMFPYQYYRLNYNIDDAIALWETWQTLTAAMVALLASFFALDATKLREERQRKRDFKAEKAFLPQVFSTFLDYLEECAYYIREIREKEENNELQLPMNRRLPDPPLDYEEVFKNCIRKSDKDFGDVLVYTLTSLQIHQSRFENLQWCAGYVNNPQALPSGYYKSYLYRLAEIQEIITKNFEFVRSTEKFEKKRLTYDQISLGLRRFDIYTDGIEDFERFAKGIIDREKRKI